MLKNILALILAAGLLAFATVSTDGGNGLTNSAPTPLYLGWPFAESGETISTWHNHHTPGACRNDHPGDLHVGADHSYKCGFGTDEGDHGIHLPTYPCCAWDFYAQDWNFASGSSECSGVPRVCKDLLSATPGEVVDLLSTDPGCGTYGRFVVVSFDAAGENFFIRYTHLDTVSVNLGDTVTLGQKLGTVGDSGVCSSTAHLHVAVYRAYSVEEHNPEGQGDAQKFRFCPFVTEPNFGYHAGCPAGTFVSSGVCASTSHCSDGPSDLYLVDHVLADAAAVGTIRTPEGLDVTIGDIAMSPSGQLFGASYTLPSTLYSIDRGTAMATAMTQSTGFPLVDGLAFRADGTLFGATDDGRLIEIDTVTGAATEIGAFGSDLESVGDLAFSPSGTLYAVVAPSGHQIEANSNFLATIDVETGTATKVDTNTPVGFVVGGLGFTGNRLLGYTLLTPGCPGDDSLDFGARIVIDETTGAGSTAACVPFQAFAATTNCSQFDADGDWVADGCDTDADGDLVADVAEGQCGDALDDDGNGLLNDGCPQVGTVSETGAECANFADDDGDGWINDGCPGTSETNACGANSFALESIPERVDGAFAGVDDDGDTQVDEPLPPSTENYDCDGDGYTGTAESHVYSYLPEIDGDQKVCGLYDAIFPDPNQSATPSQGWPSDFVDGGVPDSTEKITLTDLTSFLAPVRYFGTNVGTNTGDVRWDISPGPGVLGTDINLLDLTALIAGSTGNPPMFGGQRAFNGPLCPYAS